MTTYDIEIKKPIFNDVYYPDLDRETRIQIVFGGASSGKSVFQAQRVARDLLRGGRNYLCVRKVSRTCRGSIFNELCKVINDWNLSGLFKINKSEMSVTCANGYQAVCSGIDDPEKIKSITPIKGVFTDIWVEEATECAEDDVKQLNKRLRGKAKGLKKRLFLTFNPILKSHWIYKTFFSGRFGDDDTRYEDDQVFILKTTYLDNRFLETDDIAALLSEVDQYYYDVYTLGKWGVLGDLVFTNWRIDNIRQGNLYNTFDLFRNGLDFGFSNDPTHLVRSYYHRASRTLYITDEYYNKGVTNDEIAAGIEPIVGEDAVICDSAEPKSIAELCMHGINAIGAAKGKDSINHGIQWLKQQEIIIDENCIHIIGNFEQYHWVKDRNGNVLNKPCDRDNHGIDALRYSYEDESMTTEISAEGIGVTESSLADWN